ncbi:MAG: serine/threonine protein kinase [Burkholderiales bacterium]|nr:serine/threonine protein kinase [Burkholderiales bacterium]
MTTPDRLGKYGITEVLGQGAMGVVYKGFDPGIGRSVAIKTIRRELIEGSRPAASMLARFRNEARAAGQLSHPGIVAVYDYGEDAEVAYIAMEYVEGNSLREYFERGTRFDERDAVSIMTQLLDALAHAHGRRVWHRDVKPANLIVMMDGRVKVADFGIARIETSDLTRTGAVMGSPGYMAPEQYAAAAIDHRADIFAAGVVFYELLTGGKPFVGSTAQIAYAICHADAPRPSLVDPDKGWERYDAIVAKALAKRPEDRFRSAEAFREAIVEAHAAPASPAIAAETIITEVLRPAAAVDVSSPSGPPSAPPLAPGARPARGGKRWGAIAGVATAVVVVAAGAAWYAREQTAPETVAAAPAPPAPAAPARAQPEQEVVFWESVRNSANPAELEAYLAKYREGAFAPLARARLEALAEARKRAAEPAPKAASAPPAPERKPAAPEQPRATAKADQEALFWESVRASSNPAELNAYLERYPQGTFAPLARARLAAIAAAEAKRAAAVTPVAAAATAMLQPPPAEARAPAKAPSRFDGRWMADLACEQFMEMQAFRRAFPTEIRDGVVELSRGTPGTPGYWRVRGQVGESDRLALVGSVIAASQAFRGKENPARFDGQFGPRGFEATGAFGKRRCTLALARAGS